MSFVSVVPDIVAAAAGNIAGIGSALSEASAAAAAPTIGLLPMAADEISGAVMAAFAGHAQQFQALSAQAAAFHDQFVRTLSGGLGAYVSTEFANAGQAVAAAAEPVTQSFNLPFGPLQLSASITNSPPSSDGSFFNSGSATATLGPLTLLSASGSATGSANGPLGFSMTGTTPYGPVGLSLNGFTSTPPQGTPTMQITGGSLSLSPAIPLLAALYGPTIVGGASLTNSTTTALYALGTGDWLGAGTAYLTSPLNYTNAVLFGTTTVTLPDPSWVAPLGLTSSYPQVHIPFGGLFAPASPITVTVPSMSSSGGNILGSEFALQGTKFGGYFAVLANSVGIPV